MQGQNTIRVTSLCSVSLIHSYFHVVFPSHSPCASSVLCCLFQSISKLSLKSIYYLISRICTSSSIPRWFGSFSSRARMLPRADRHDHCINTLEDTKDCLVMYGNISLWPSHTVTPRAYMSFFLSPEPHTGHCPVCVCVDVCAFGVNGSVLSHFQLLTAE